jgi:hypothetical protein
MGHPTHLLMALTWDRPPAPTRPWGHNYPLNTYLSSYSNRKHRRVQRSALNGGDRRIMRWRTCALMHGQDGPIIVAPRHLDNTLLWHRRDGGGDTGWTPVPQVLMECVSTTTLRSLLAPTGQRTVATGGVPARRDETRGTFSLIASPPRKGRRRRSTSHAAIRGAALHRPFRGGEMKIDLVSTGSVPARRDSTRGYIPWPLRGRLPLDAERPAGT